MSDGVQARRYVIVLIKLATDDVDFAVRIIENHRSGADSRGCKPAWILTREFTNRSPSRCARVSCGALPVSSPPACPEKLWEDWSISRSAFVTFEAVLGGTAELLAKPSKSILVRRDGVVLAQRAPVRGEPARKYEVARRGLPHHRPGRPWL